jgi:phosphatidylserine/phosphatidylglycerophosphate/cardiolipin synthase-like enzyme
MFGAVGGCGVTEPLFTAGLGLAHGPEGAGTLEATGGTLRALAAALRRGQLAAPLTPLAVARVAPGASAAVVEELLVLFSEGMQPAHLALLLDARASAIEAGLEGAAQLVWTGPDSPHAYSRDTAVVLRELFGIATRSILLSTFVIRQPDIVFKPLAERMMTVPGLSVRLFVHVGRNDGDTRHDSEILREYADRFRRSWPGSVFPTVYYDPRSLVSNVENRATWHAKVVVIDEAVSLITSANFTEWAQQRNVEAGALIRSAGFARQLCQQFESLIQARSVCEVPGVR